MTHGPLRDTKSDLLEAAQAAVRDREGKAAAQAVVSTRAPRRRRRIGVLMAVGLVGLGLLALRPEWLVGPVKAPPDPPAVALAGLRVTLVRERQLVFDYAKAHGRLPQSLREAGDSATGVRYARKSDSTFTLSGNIGDSVVVLHSGDLLSAFLGNSLRIVKNRGAR